MSRRTQLCLALGAFAFLALTIAVSVWFYHAPHRAVDRIHDALRRSDTNALARDIDFPALQASLKAQVTAIVTNKMAQDAPDQPVNPIAQAIALGVVKHLSTEYITPAGLCRLLSGQVKVGKKETGAALPNHAELDRAFTQAVREYRATDQFVVYFTGRNGEVSELIFLRQGLRWRLRDIILPVPG